MALYITIATGILGGITGTIFFGHERKAIYPIVCGITLALIGYTIDISASNKLKNEIEKYNIMLKNNVLRNYQ